MSSKIFKPEKIDNLPRWFKIKEIDSIKSLLKSGHKIRFSVKRYWKDEVDETRKSFDFLKTDPTDIKVILTIKHPQNKGYYINLIRCHDGDISYHFYKVNEVGGYKLYRHDTMKNVMKEIEEFEPVDFKKIAKTIEIKGFDKSCLMKNSKGVASWNDILSHVGVLYPVTMQGTKIDKDVAKANSDIWFLLQGVNGTNSKITIVSNGSKYYFGRISREKVYVKRVLDMKLTDRDEKLIKLAMRLYVEKINV
jgi:hypothetical protein